MLSPLRDRAPAQPVPSAWSRLAMRVATLGHCAGHALPNLLLAMLSWAIAEVLAGCAAYAEALYPVPAPAVADTSGQVPSLPARPSLSLVSEQTYGGAPRSRPAPRTANPSF